MNRLSQSILPAQGATVSVGGDAIARDVTIDDVGICKSARVDSVYIHVPFCFHKCHYCDFYSIVDNRDRQGVFVDRLMEEIEWASEFLTFPLKTIFVGGGTPTLLTTGLWEKLLRAMEGWIPGGGALEFTVEANPETVTDKLAQVLVGGGVNRMSIGAQTFNPALLEALQRWNSVESVEKSVLIFRKWGISSLNLDLIFGIPGQTLEDWKTDLDRAIDLGVEHLSCYNLMYEPNTPLTVKMKSGAVTRVDEDIEADMFEWTRERMAASGYEHYEISNWAKPGHRCEHNLTYWRNGNWWPLGPGAAGHVDGLRWKNVPRLGGYVGGHGEGDSPQRHRGHREGGEEKRKVGGAHPTGPAIQDVERLDEDGRVGEELMLGLRLMEGIEGERLEGLLSRGKRGEERRGVIEKFVGAGLLEWGGSINRRVAEAQRETRRGEGEYLLGEERRGEEGRGEEITTEITEGTEGEMRGILRGEERRGEEGRGLDSRPRLRWGQALRGNDGVGRGNDGEGGLDTPDDSLVGNAQHASLRLTERGLFLSDLVLGELV